MDHPEINLEEELNKPVSELTRKFYRDILDSMELTNVQARAILTEIQEVLVEIAGIVNSPWMHEQRGVKMRDPRDIRISELVPIVREAAINAHIEMTRIQEKNKDTDFYKAENKRLAASADRLERENAAHQQAWENQEEVIVGLRDQLASLKDIGTKEVQKTINEATISLDEESLAAHYQKFIVESSGVAEVFFLVAAVGDVSKMRSPDLRKSFAVHFNLADKDPEGKGGRVSDAFKLADKYKLFKAEIPDNDERRRGRPVQIYTLTYIGRYFYEKHTGKKYVSPDYLDSHKSHAQALLVMESEALLREAGYEIHEPHEMRDGTHQFKPDIAASLDGAVIYCEVERNTPREHQDQDAKWRNFRHFSNGQMYVFYGDRQCKDKAIRSATVAMQHPDDRLHLCDVSKARQNLKDKGTLWTASYKGRSL